ncbi:MAG: hypothetical protein QXF79_01860, partial [Ignisphaera sp.]
MKIRKERETRLISEWVQQNYKDALLIRFRCPLGPIPEKLVQEVGFSKAIGYARPYRPEVDALIIYGQEIILAEAKIFKVMDGLSKLPIYGALVPQTPELKQYLPRKIVLKLITPKKIPWLENICNELGVEVIVYQPDWVKEYLQELEKYWTKDVVEERLRRKK